MILLNEMFREEEKQKLFRENRENVIVWIQMMMDIAIIAVQK